MCVQRKPYQKTNNIHWQPNVKICDMHTERERKIGRNENTRTESNRIVKKHLTKLNFQYRVPENKHTDEISRTVEFRYPGRSIRPKNLFILGKLSSGLISSFSSRITKFFQTFALICFAQAANTMEILRPISL